MGDITMKAPLLSTHKTVHMLRALNYAFHTFVVFGALMLLFQIIGIPSANSHFDNGVKTETAPAINQAVSSSPEVVSALSGVKRELQLLQHLYKTTTNKVVRNANQTVLISSWVAVGALFLVFTVGLLVVTLGIGGIAGHIAGTIVLENLVFLVFIVGLKWAFSAAVESPYKNVMPVNRNNLALKHLQMCPNVPAALLK